MKHFMAGTLNDEVNREDLKSRTSTLRKQLAAGHIDEATTTYFALDDWLRPIAECDLRHLLLQTLSWSDEDHHLASRLQNSVATLADLGRQVATGCAQRLPRGDPRTLEAIARAMIGWASAEKFEQLAAVPKAERQRFHDLHRLFATAEEQGATHFSRHFSLSGQEMEASIESLYVRALLLSRLTGGNLTAQQIEILDNWLLSWMPSMWVTLEPPEGDIALRVRLHSSAGLVQGVFAVADDARHVCIAPLRQRLDETIAALHQGNLFPGWGLATEMRVEDHIVVLDSLQRELARIEEGSAAKRLHRTQAFGMVVDTHVGLTNVLAGAFDPLHRGMRMRLQDHNETGVGFLADPVDGKRIQIGDLIAMHLDPTQAAVIGEVVRKRPSLGDEDVAVGVRLLSRECVPVEFEFEDRGGHPDATVQAIFFAGGDNSGRHDAIVVSESVFKSGKVLRTEDEGEIFRVSLNRARHRGRGWVIAGFEMLVDNADDAAIKRIALRPVPVGVPSPASTPGHQSRLELQLADWPEGRPL